MIALIIAMLLFFSTAIAADIPPAVEKALHDKYSQEYPTDSKMRNLCIEKEIKEYLFMQGYTSVPGVPQDFFDAIKQEYQTKFPLNFHLQHILIENQMNNYLEQNKTGE